MTTSSIPMVETETGCCRLRETAEQGRLLLSDYPRLARLRSQLLSAKPTLCIHRARLITEFYRQNGFGTESIDLHKAKALAHILDHLPVTIFDDELIVGSTTSHRYGIVLFPEFTAMTLWPELPTIARRDINPQQITDEESDFLSEEIFPFWRDHTMHEIVRRAGGSPESFRVFERFLFFLNTKSNGVGHLIPDYASLVQRGLTDIIHEAADREKKAGDGQTADFHRAVQVALFSVIRFAERYAEGCEEKARVADPERARELMETAAILRKAPASPASTLHEALQSVWLTHVALHQENSNAPCSFGRFDQFLYPYYRDDLAAGRLDKKRAGELVGAAFIKMGDNTIITPRAGLELMGGASVNEAMTIGGLTPDGADGVNDLTMLMLDISSILGLRDPNMTARVHKDSSPEYRHALIESIHRTGASPALFNDDAIVDALAANGIDLPDARDYGVVGCVETTSVGRTMGLTGALILNLAAVLELAMHDGIHPLSGSRIGPPTGRLEDFAAYDQFYGAFTTQLEHLVGLAVDCNSQFARAHEKRHPTPLLSALIQGTAEAGRDVTRGGAKYNSSGIGVVGLADVADSLSALKYGIFQERIATPGELSTALKADFAGYEKLQTILSRKAPKYGTDDPKADQTINDLVELVGRTFGQHKNPRGGRYHVGYWSLTMHAGAFGSLTSSLPSGRIKGTPLASGATPVSGVARKGPTAALSSTAKLPAQYVANCIANNHKFPRSLLADPDKRVLLERLVRGYFKKGGMQVQFNVHDKNTLLFAQAHPEQYRDLLVRVSGYSAYFCDLSRAMQDEIIARTEDGF